MSEPGLLLVRATIHLVDLDVGEEVYVDPSDPYVADLLEGTFLIPVGEPHPAPVRDSDGGESGTRDSDGLGG